MVEFELHYAYNPYSRFWNVVPRSIPFFRNVLGTADMRWAAMGTARKVNRVIQHETDISAIEDSEKQNSRISRKNENARRTKAACPPPPKRKEESQRINLGKFEFPRSSRLVKSSEFKEVFDKGTKRVNTEIVSYVLREKGRTRCGGSGEAD